MKTRTGVLVSKREWDRFLATVEELVNVHTQLLEQVRELKRRDNIMKEQLRDALYSKTREISQRITYRVEQAAKQLAQMEGQSMELAVCANCGRELYERYKYCDGCGSQLEW